MVVVYPPIATAGDSFRSDVPGHNHSDCFPARYVRSHANPSHRKRFRQKKTVTPGHRSSCCSLQAKLFYERRLLALLSSIPSNGFGRVQTRTGNFKCFNLSPRCLRLADFYIFLFNVIIIRIDICTP